VRPASETRHDADSLARRAGRLAGAALFGVCLLCAVAPAMAGWFWVASVASEFAPQAAAVSFAYGLCTLLRRRWALGAALLLCASAQVASLDRVRAARAPAGALDIRLLVFNTGTEPPRTDSLLRRLGASDADVVVLVEAPPELVRLLHRESPLASSYPHVLMRGPSPDRTTWRIVLSRWPLEDRRTDRQLVCVVGAPVGGFGLIAVHPASPRDPRRWRWGNQLVEDAARCARDLAEEGLPVIVAGDLNATPSGWRSRLLRDRASLRRCKPLLVPAGTFPASLPPALRLALDDAWVSDEFAVSRWRLGPAEGSDHASVRIDLRLDPGPGGDGPAGAPGAPGGLAPGR
jgi:endonuclease/exonuclease/phosphatase (EEP) superfamily protein YafD